MNEKNDIQIITGGLGLNFGVFYADLAYLHKASKLNGLFYYYETPKGQVIESPEFQRKKRSSIALSPCTGGAWLTKPFFIQGKKELSNNKIVR